MVIRIMSIFIKFILLLNFLILFAAGSALSVTTEQSFDEWLSSYKKFALKKGISKQTLEVAFKDVKFLENVIKYDRKQPEFFEDTLTYVGKRASKKRAILANRLLNSNSQLFLKVESNFNVEKEILLALWGIETNFGRHVGKMDIISSLATLTYDKRRSKFFSSELISLLRLIDKNIINPNTLYGSWAGAYGNFQFMPSTITRYAIDYDNNNKIELKESLDDALASAANYINKIGWKKGEPCFFRVKINKKIEDKYFNSSARKISNKLKISEWKQKGVVNFDGSELKTNFKAALILPDGKPNSPMYLVFDNYQKILKWNRSLRFGISVCTLAEMIKA